ncbi:MAG: hypothetical protein R3B09_12155 [Nannocystaceae bacterium]
MSTGLRGLRAALVGLAVASAPTISRAAPEVGIDWADAASKPDGAEAATKSKPKATKKSSRARPSAKERREAEVAREREALRAATQEESARRHREAARARADALVAAGRPAEAARELAIVAGVDRDPLLYLAAAEASLAALDSRERGGDGLSLAQAYVAAAEGELRRLGADPAALARLGLDADTIPAVEAHVGQVRGAIDRHIRAERRRRAAVGETVSGAVLTTIGISGLAVMGGGLYLDRAADAELARAGVKDVQSLPADLQPGIEAQYDRASTMTSVGAIAGAGGIALGVTLFAIGVRDLKATGGLSRKRAAIQAAPTLGGIVIQGRF